MIEMIAGASIMLIGILFGWALARAKFNIEDED